MPNPVQGMVCDFPDLRQPMVRRAHDALQLVRKALADSFVNGGVQGPRGCSQDEVPPVGRTA